MSIFVSNNTAGETKVREIYGELLVPVTSGSTSSSAIATRTTPTRRRHVDT